MARIEQHHWWFVGRRAVIRSALKHLRLPKRAQILEPGCGAGGNLHLLAEFGQVSAFEPNAAARAFAVTRSTDLGSVDIRDGTLPDIVPFAKNNFDLLVAFDVIEHLDEDIASCRALCETLKPRGRALFTVPAFMFMWSEHDEALHHKRRYTKQSFLDVLAAAGFAIDHAAYFNFWLFPPIAAARIMARLLGRTSEAGDHATMPSPAVNSILASVFSSERFFVPFVPLPFGVSILVSAHRY